MLVFFRDWKKQRGEMNFNASLPLIFSSFFLLPARPPSGTRTHSRSLVPLVLLARSPNAGTAAIFLLLVGERRGEGERGGEWKRRQRKKFVNSHSRFVFLPKFIIWSLSPALVFQKLSLSISLVLVRSSPNRQHLQRRREEQIERERENVKPILRSPNIFFGFVGRQAFNLD